jgi:DNA polymerase-2
MPTIRNSTAGSKKRYAGVVRKNGEEKLVFKGLENVRTDWTNLAKQFQEEVFRRVFAGEPVEAFIRDVFEAVRSGQRDDTLIYRKRLRRKLSEYKKNVPPHVQAARKQVAWTGEKLNRGDWIEYVITTNGPEPVASRRSPIDYQHYLDRQLAPVADSVLQFVNLSFSTITARQQDLFE